MAASGYLPAISQTKRKKKFSSFCETFRAWKSGDDQALDSLLAQGYERLFMPKAVRLARPLPPNRENHPKKILDQAWVSIASREREQLESFSQFLQCFQLQLEQEVSRRLSQPR